MVNTLTKQTMSANFTQIHNDMWTDMRLSGDALRVLGYLLSKPDDWVIREMDIRKKFAPIGRDIASNHFYRKITKNLQEAGYMRKRAIRDDSGQITKWETEISDYPAFLEPHFKGSEPVVENSTCSDSPDVEFTTCGEFDPLSNKDSYNNTKSPLFRT